MLIVSLGLTEMEKVGRISKNEFFQCDTLGINWCLPFLQKTQIEFGQLLEKKKSVVLTVLIDGVA